VKTFDTAVVGLGTMGTFACRDFARRGLSVIGFDQFDPPHDRGSHTGDTRVFRTAYAEHPDYVPLAQHAGALWDQLGAEEGATFLHRTGLLSVGEPESALIAGTKASAEAYDLTVQSLFPQKKYARGFRHSNCVPDGTAYSNRQQVGLTWTRHFGRACGKPKLAALRFIARHVWRTGSGPGADSISALARQIFQPGVW
jgi:hypothetical protein